jgi:hypothetical protein
MVSAVNKGFLPFYSLVFSTANQQLHRSIPTQMLTMLLLRRQQLRPPPLKVVILLVVVLGLAVLLAAMDIIALHIEVPGVPRLLDVHLMRPLFVFASSCRRTVALNESIFIGS